MTKDGAMAVSLNGPDVREREERVERPEDVADEGGEEPGRDAFPVEFAGWLPCFTFFGNCGRHPQFDHTLAPPEGYRFVRSAPDPDEEGRRGFGLWTACRKVLHALWMLGRPVTSVVRHARDVGVGRSLRTAAAVVRRFFALRRAGCGFWPVVEFLRTRHFPSQVLLPRRPRLLFLTSIPFIYGEHPWIIEIEDATTLFFPFHLNGVTHRTAIRRSRYLPVIRAMLESDACRGVVTHMRSTAEAIPKLFQSEKIAAKTTYIPCGTALPPVGQDHGPSDHINLLFTCSWHQNPDSFFLRGGPDVLRAFEVLQERYPNVRLTLRTGLPRMHARLSRVIEKCWVRVIPRFLEPEEMDDLMRETHLFLIPAARIHVVSVLRAMAYGQVVVASDGWGFPEYVEHGRNGVIVPGRYGRSSWMDEETGMLRENYETMAFSSTSYSQGLIDAISTLVEDHALRRRLGRQARQDVAERYNLENWNRGLKAALDRAVGRAA
jgi:glycosyltransferase involved in cell wall biosynthesis